MKPQRQATPKRTAARWILVALLVVNALLVGRVLWGMRGSDRRAKKDAPDTPVQPALPSRSSAAGPVAPSAIGDEPPPWQATPENTPELPAGTVPAWKVTPPPPDPSSTTPPPPDEPPNPALHRAPSHNPGGVNSDRPGRRAPGVE